MAYKPRPNERKHRGLINDALVQVEFAGQRLVELKAAARNDQTKAHIQVIENHLLKTTVALYQMIEIVRGTENE